MYASRFQKASGEEDLIFWEYGEPDGGASGRQARALGERAKEYVATECNWKVVAKKYAYWWCYCSR